MNTEANALVFMHPNQFNDWLDRESWRRGVQASGGDYLTMHPVSTRINSSRAPSDDPAL